MHKNWVTRNKYIGKIAIQAVISLVEQGASEKLSCTHVCSRIGYQEYYSRDLYKMYLLVKARLIREGKWKEPKQYFFPQKCLYCGTRYGKMIAVCDFRGVPVGAHSICERLEQMVTGGM